MLWLCPEKILHLYEIMWKKRLVRGLQKGQSGLLLPCGTRLEVLSRRTRHRRGGIVKDIMI